MLSKVCSRSQGHPPGARSRAMMDTARSNCSPVLGIAITVNEAERFSLSVVKCLIQNLRVVGDEAIDAPFGEPAHLTSGIHRPGHDLSAGLVHRFDQGPINQVVARQEGLYRKVPPYVQCVSAFAQEPQRQAAVEVTES